MNTNGSPTALMRRYRVAMSSTSPRPPRIQHSGRAATATIAPAIVPRMTARPKASVATRWASSPCPEPWAKATSGVTPYSRNDASETTISKTVAAIANPPSASVLIRPTIAVSTRTYSGSTASVPSAGIARRTIRRSRSSRRITVASLSGTGVPSSRGLASARLAARFRRSPRAAGSLAVAPLPRLNAWLVGTQAATTSPGGPWAQVTSGGWDSMNCSIAATSSRGSG